MMKVNKYIKKRKCISMNRIPSALNCHLPRGTEYNFILLYVFFYYKIYDLCKYWCISFQIFFYVCVNF